MEYVYETVDALEEYFVGSPFEILAILDELYEATGEKDYKEEIDRLCREYMICPNCHRSYLKGTISDKEEIELIGQDYVPTGWCSDCGWGRENG
jgi:hypothetical protein